MRSTLARCAAVAVTLAVTAASGSAATTASKVVRPFPLPQLARGQSFTLSVNGAPANTNTNAQASLTVRFIRRLT